MSHPVILAGEVTTVVVQDVELAIPPVVQFAAIPAAGARAAFDEIAARAYLSASHWPQALQDCLVEEMQSTARRYFVIDNSDSMLALDGKMLGEDERGKPKIVKCSRWAELGQSIQFLAGLAQAAQAPSEFRLLNGADPLRVGCNEDQLSLTHLLQMLDGSPAGGTPLCSHIRDIADSIRSVEADLRATGQRVCVIIATDGEASDGDIREALRPLKALPCWVILRLCTGEQRILDYWNAIDQELELNMDVLDDLVGEAKEVVRCNPWLSYAEPLHRLREFGVSLKEMDLLGESLLSKEHLKKICRLIYGARVDALQPSTNWEGFLEGIDELNQTTPKIYSIAHHKMRYWVSTKALEKSYGKKSLGAACAERCCIS